MSEAKTVAQRTRETIARCLCVDLATVTDERSISGDMGDSLDAVELTMSIEDEFDIVVDAADAAKLAPARVSEWVTYCEARMAAKVA